LFLVLVFHALQVCDAVLVLAPLSAYHLLLDGPQPALNRQLLASQLQLIILKNEGLQLTILPAGDEEVTVAATFALAAAADLQRKLLQH